MSGSSPLQIFNRSETPVPLDEDAAASMIRLVEKGETCSFSMLELVFVTPARMRDINREYLDRSYLTDIITFRYEEDASDRIEGTLYCCPHRIREQAKELDEPVRREFMRVFVHGLLHLVGHGDDTASRKKDMRALEDRYLERWGKEKA